MHWSDPHSFWNQRLPNLTKELRALAASTENALKALPIVVSDAEAPYFLASLCETFTVEACKSITGAHGHGCFLQNIRDAIVMPFVNSVL